MKEKPKIALNPQQTDKFVTAYKIGALKQLHKKGFITAAQLRRLLEKVDKP